MASSPHAAGAEPWSDSDEEMWSGEDEDEVDALDVNAAEKRLLMHCALDLSTSFVLAPSSSDNLPPSVWHALNVLPMIQHAAFIHACTMQFDRLRALHVWHDGSPSEAQLKRRQEIFDAENKVVAKQRDYIEHGGAAAEEADEQLALIVDLRHDLVKQAEEEEELSSEPNSSEHKAAQRARTLLDATLRHANTVTARGERCLKAYAIEHLQNALYDLNRQHPLLGRPLDRVWWELKGPLLVSSAAKLRVLELRQKRNHNAWLQASRSRNSAAVAALEAEADDLDDAFDRLEEFDGVSTAQALLFESGNLN
ncbi:hypothetical protein JCM9279_006275 [Rhodotorula babjevae]